MAGENTKTIALNKKARHDYFIMESFEAGIELVGTEVKSIRTGGVNLKDSWCSIENGELIVKQMHISPYEHGNIFNRDPLRERKLLMHKAEINRLFGLVKMCIRDRVWIAEKFQSNPDIAGSPRNSFRASLIRDYRR